ncbi:MAG: flagellar biosynthesis anti-sigma factor FlgM [Myxococcales bacterium]|nr:flagellar biosynthesis anti-sigma factor FlgM [Myxococcales bacterium]
MTVKINGLVPQGNVGRPVGKPAAKKSESEGSASAGDAAQVELSGKSPAAAVVSAAAKDVPEVDETKVAELRAMIARGEYTADLRLVAERMIAEAIAFEGR